MNYLAHAYLSFGDPDILAGNMISDFVKGKKKFEYPDRVQMGITLHRKIDEYTDAHPATHQAIKFLKDAAGPYAGAFVDIVYDHFLANAFYAFEEGALPFLLADLQSTGAKEVCRLKISQFFSICAHRTGLPL